MSLKLRDDSEKSPVVKGDKFILQEYEALYVSNRKSIPNLYFEGMSRKQQNEQALKIVRFAIEKYLRWTPQDVKHSLTPEVIKKLKLNILIDTYIDFPPEYSKNGMDITYLAYLLYPDKFHLSMEEQCINMFHRIIRGDLKKYPSTWIDSNSGVLRLGILIRYVIKQLPRFKSPEALYEYFSSPNGMKTLRDYKLYTFAMALYPNIITAVHQALPPNAKSDFLYNVQLFEKDCGNAKIKM